MLSGLFHWWADLCALCTIGRDPDNSGVWNSLYAHKDFKHWPMASCEPLASTNFVQSLCGKCRFFVFNSTPDLSNKITLTPMRIRGRRMWPENWQQLGLFDVFIWIHSHCHSQLRYLSWISLSMGSANERRHYYVMPPLIGWAYTQNDPWSLLPQIFLPQLKPLSSHI